MGSASPRDEDFWVFGYGSLMWNPAFHHAEQRAARLAGWHRSFCFWNTFGRGSPENPGLTLALESGGSCLGVALRIAAADVRSELGVLWNDPAIGADWGVDDPILSARDLGNPRRADIPEQFRPHAALRT